MKITSDNKELQLLLNGDKNFVPHEQPIPTNPHGQYIWLEIKGVELKEIIDYHEGKVKR